MFAKILLFLMFFTSFSYADEYIPGEGRFWAAEGESVSFIKDQLLYESTKDVITKQLTKMGLSAELFWQKYNDKLDASVSRMDEVLKEEYKIGTDEESKSAREKYRKELRRKTLLKRKKFGNLESVVQSYSIRKQSRSSKNPQSRFMKIEAKLLQNKLSEIYYRFVRGKKSSDYGKLFVQIKYNLKGITFSEMGIDNEKDFVRELSQNWVDSLAKQRPSNIANVEVLSDDLSERLDATMALSPEEVYRTIPDVFVNSLLLTVYIDIDKKSKDEEHKKIDIAYNGGLQLKDLQTGTIVWNSSLNQARQNFEYDSEKDIGQKVINAVYRMPLGDYRSMTASIERFSPVALVKKINLFNYDNLGQVNTLVNYLEQIGVQYSLKASVLTLTPTRSEILMQLDAGETELRALLKGHEAAKKDLTFELIDSDGTIGIKFNHEPIEKSI